VTWKRTGANNQSAAREYRDHIQIRPEEDAEGVRCPRCRRNLDTRSCFEITLHGEVIERCPCGYRHRIERVYASLVDDGGPDWPSGSETGEPTCSP
jgi:hypothetical protein